MGRANADAIELARRHCRHARIEAVHGNSVVGNALALPMGLLQVRCEHAPPPTSLGHNALELEVEFYRSNCVGCTYREPSGEFPNLATVVAELDRDKAKQRERVEREAMERARRHAARRERRKSVIATEGYVVRELAEWLDDLDAPAPRSSELSADEEKASRQIIESARHAPQLFSPLLVETLLGLAADTAEPSAFVAISELVGAQKCGARAAVEAALAGLTIRPEPEAARLLKRFNAELHPSDLSPVLDCLIRLASNQEEPWGPEPVPDGLVAAAAVDLPTVTNRIVMLLDSDDEAARGAAADAAAVLLVEDSARIIALGPPLTKSIRGKDTGYAGYPHPGTSAAKALAEAWRNEPERTMSIVESNASDLPDESKALLLRVTRFIQRFRQQWDVSNAAGSAAVDFCLRHLGGDWGDEAADEASDQLEHLARAVPQLLIPHIDALVGQVLSMTTPVHVSPLLAEPPPIHLSASAIEAATTKITRGARLRRIAQALGRIAKTDSASVLARLLPLFQAEQGDEAQVQEVRLIVLDALEQAACVDVLRDLLPVLYTALLNSDPPVRGAGIDLWAACASAADGQLPAEFADLAPTMLADTYVVVHRRMLKRLRELYLPDHVAAKLIGLVAGWAKAYIDNADVLDDAVWSLRYLAQKLGDSALCAAWYEVALSFAPNLNPYDRERFLAADWPEALLQSNSWAPAAVATLASPELVDHYNQRHEPLLAILMERPKLLASVPLDDVIAVSDVHEAPFLWRAFEPIELLQSAGRWSDAAAVAERVAERQPPGLEGQYGRQLAGLVASSTHHAQLLADGNVSETTAAASLAAVRQAVDAFMSCEPAHQAGGAVALLIDTAIAPVLAAEALAARATANPDHAAGQLDEAASRLHDAAGDSFASGAQRRLLAGAWRIAELLMRYDGAVRSADPAANRFLVAAKREAEVLNESIGAEADAPMPSPLTEFLAIVTAIRSAHDVSSACNVLAAAPAPLRLVGQLEPARPAIRPAAEAEEHAFESQESLLAVCVADLRGSPVTDVLVVHPNEVYTLGITVWISSWPEWADTCTVEPVTSIAREALSLPKFVFSARDVQSAETGVLLEAQGPLFCAVEQPVRDPAIDCPLVVRFSGNGKEQSAEVAGYRRLRLRPFDPSKDTLTEHEQTDQRLLAMFDRLTSPDYDTEDARAFCRLFSACVRAAQLIMFDKTFRKGARVTEAMFHDELERMLRADPELQGRITRRDAVAGGFDDLLHDDVIAELKVARDKPVTVEDCARYLGQPTQYGVGRGSQLSVLVVLDHSRKEAPPGVLENYLGWLQPRLHGLEDPAYPSLVGVLIINTNLPVPSAWSRKQVS